LKSDMGIERSWSDDQLTGRIIQCIIRVHQELGPGFVEKVYRRSLTHEFRDAGLAVAIERPVLIHYKRYKVGIHLLDMLVENRIVIELKCADSLCRAHYAQVRSYLKATKLKTALLVNFSGERADYRRIENK
jgi:GxxExxY protein